MKQLDSADETTQVHQRTHRLWRTKQCACGDKIGWWVYPNDQKRTRELVWCAACAALRWAETQRMKLRWHNPPRRG